jgi:RNA polymerase sigma-B factor
MRDASSPTPERELFRRVAEGDASARDELIERHIGLAQRLASRYRNSGEPLDDLRQVAMVGLINSVDRYDPEAGPFIRYAVPNILGELKRHFRDKSWGIHVPRSLQERSLKVGNAVEALSSRLGHTPSPREVAEATGMTLEEVLEAMDVSSAYTPGALDAPLPGDDGGQRTVVDTLGDEDDRYELVELRQSVAPAFRDLPRREQVILKLRFMDDKTQAEIATEVGVSQMHVSRLLRRSLHQLSEAVDGPPPARGQEGEPEAG